MKFALFPRGIREYLLRVCAIPALRSFWAAGCRFISDIGMPSTRSWITFPSILVHGKTFFLIFLIMGSAGPFPSPDRPTIEPQDGEYLLPSSLFNLCLVTLVAFG